MHTGLCSTRRSLLVSLAVALLLPAMTASAAPPTPVGESEANGTVGTADRLAADCVSVGSGGISPIGDVDFWSFRGTAGDRVWVHVSTGTSSTSTDSVLELLAPDGVTVIEADDDDGPGLSSLIAGAELTETGTHYLRINEFADNNTITPYRVHVAVTSETDAESEPNDPAPQAAPPCLHRTSAALDPGGDVDRYEVDLEQDDRLLVAVDDDPERDSVRTNTRITVEDPGGVELDTTMTEVLVVDASTSGKHVVKVDSPAASTGSYGLVAATAGLEGETEANGSAGGADPLPSGCDVSGTGAIAPIGDVDFWSFQALAGSHVWAYIDTLRSEASTDSVLELLAPNGTSLLETDDDDGPGLSSLIAGHGLGTGGSHYLRINEFADNGTIDPYTSHLSITTETESEAEPNDAEPQRGPDCETRVRGEMESAGDVDRYSLDLKPGERLFAVLDSDPERDSTSTGLRLTLDDPTGAEVQTTTTRVLALRAESAGTHELRVEGPGGPGTYALHVSTGEPPANTSIDSGPADGSTVSESAPTFEFSSDEPGSAFECSVDGGAFAACSSPHTVASLGDGSHTFAVQAIDEGRPDPSPATRDFTIDATPPQTSIDFGPAEGATAAGRTPAFGFSSSEPGSSFECRIDREGFRPCVSPDTLSPLTDGAHTFAVRATDAAGNTDPEPATRGFVVDTSHAAVPPDTSGPDTSGPDLSVSGPRRQSVRRIRVGLMCADEPCLAAVTGRVVAVAPRAASSGARSARRLRKKFKFSRVTRIVDAGTQNAVRVKLRRNRRSVRRVRRLIRRGWTVTAAVRVKALDVAGNEATARRVLRLRR